MRNGKSKFYILFYHNISDYVDYKFLKKKINELKTKEEFEAKNFHLENSISKTMSYQTASNNSEEIAPLEKIIKSHLGKYIKLFLTFLEEEIKKFYKLYLSLEKEFYRKINAHLYTQSRYEDLYLNEILEELGKLEQLINEILEFSNYINLNLTAIRKILKKFDKKFNLQNNPMALYFFREKLTDSSSNLVYVLQFKLIDECSAVVERLITELDEIYKIKRKDFKQTGNDIEKMISEPLLKEMNLSMLSGGLEVSEVEKIFEGKFFKIKELNEKIDESNNLIRTNVEFWYVNTLKAEFDMAQIEEYKNVMVNYIEEEKILNNLIPQVRKSIQICGVKENIYFINIWLTLTHTLLFTINAFIVMPSNPGYLEHLGSSPFLTGLIISMTPLAAIISTFFYSSLVNSGYKSSFIISVIFLILGNFLYSFADYFRSVLIMALGRIFVGLGGARVVNRRYLLEQVPSRLILHYSLLYVIMLCLGMAAGPAVALILFTLPEFNYISLDFNAFTYPGWACIIMWFIFSVILFSFFNDHVMKLHHSSKSADYSSPRKFIEESSVLITLNKQQSDSLEKCIKGINRMNESFSMINLVDKGIETLIKEEEEQFSYISLAFTILSLILFSLRMTSECMYILVTLILPYKYGFTPYVVCIFLCLVSLIVLPMSFVINHLSKFTHERILLKIIILISMTCCLLLIPLFYGIHFSQFFIVFSILFVSSNITESVDSSLLAKIMPSHSQGNMNKFINPGLTIILTTTGGRFFGSVLISIFGFFFGFDHIQTSVFTFLFLIHLILIILVVRFYSHLRVKAISRIMKKKYINVN